MERELAVDSIVKWLTAAVPRRELGESTGGCTF